MARLDHSKKPRKTKAKAQDIFRVHGSRNTLNVASNCRITFSADNRRVKTRYVKAVTQVEPPPIQDSDDPLNAPDLPPMLDSIPLVFCEEVAGVQVIAKPKAKRYESSIQNLQGNLTAYDFYRALELQTDGNLRAALPDRLSAFMCMIREWRNCRQLKRGGRGHDPGGVDATQEGELAVLCRACPHPGKNLPQGWEKDTENAHLYQEFICGDGNFRVKGRQRETKFTDVTLSPGWSYFVENEAYRKYLQGFTNQEEISTCAGFQAMHLANTKKKKGLHATGVGGVACSRHEMWRPNGLGDLQRGERYCNMDYILMSSLVFSMVLIIVASYDIACQFFKNFFSRITSLPEKIQFQGQVPTIIPKVPKAHIIGHGLKCQTKYSFTWSRGVGRTDGEGIERLWSKLNKAAPSTQEMTPSGRRETLDDFCGFSNWMKTLGLGDLLLRRIIEALKQAKEHIEEFEALNETIASKYPERVAQWEKMAEDFEKDPKKPCPHVVDASEKLSVAEVRKTLLLNELSDDGNEHNTMEDGPTAFISLGMEIEDDQSSLQNEVKAGGRLNVLEEVSLTERRLALRRKIERFRDAQNIHMPLLKGSLPAGSLDPAAQPWNTCENIPLHFPSSLNSNVRSRVCGTNLTDIEDQLQYARLAESLEELRQHLRTRMFANQYKVKNVTGQKANTRARQWQKTIDRKVLSSKRKYQRSWIAVKALRGPGEWEKTYRLLEDGDVRGFNERALSLEEQRERESARRAAGIFEEEIAAEPLDAGLSLGEGRHTLSWIWLTGGGSIKESIDSEALHSALRAEWARSRSRALGWWDEVDLLTAEIRHSLEFCRWMSSWWSSKCTARTGSDVDAELLEGIVAYAQEQSTSERLREKEWLSKWGAIHERAMAFLAETTDSEATAQTQDDGEQTVVEFEIDDISDGE
ncbi:hypothetical protein NLI96_g11205 [Meripilus lineatus]|uniref:CxC2-like cysteine cluster KDZ transposase-associated domain-containing protein n=1 Tax=Meripilus lineatus TaxID=2056292 RepID=A0AAD5UTR6_9APHY|nr:hypothetical protein NLI96_g11205 [Physisporinus lineatus]